MPHFDILYDDFQGGLGAVLGQPVSATPEWDLLRDRHRLYLTGATTIHEFAHAVMNLCFTREDHTEVTELYDEALQVNAFPGSYAMTNVDEFFAETSSAYLNVRQNDWLAGNQRIQDALRTTLPRTFAFMERVYGEPPLPPPIPTPGPLRHVVNRDHKYAYSIEIPKDWTRRASGDVHKYWEVDEYHQGNLAIHAVNLASGTTLEQFAQSIRDELLGWRPAEITSFERTQVGGRDAYSIAYRVRESPDDVYFGDIVETVVVASSLPGNPQGFRAIYEFGNWVAWNYGALRTRVLDSFRVFAE